MKSIFAASLLLAVGFPSWAIAQTCNNEIVDPAPFSWDTKTDVYGKTYFTGTMEIARVENLSVGGETITTRVYRQGGQEGGTIPGPTLFMQPGQKYVLKFHNTLPFEPRSPEHNVFKDPNVSNLHTHGLHISGESPGDDVTRDFAGGEGGDFVYDIPEDHMGGTFWYHAHHHGSTFLQVSAGAFGLIVIDDSADLGVPTHVQEMDERHLVVAYLDPDVAGTGGDTLITGTLSPTWTVNGKVNGDVCMPPDTWQHWRLLLADRDAKEKTVSIGNGCEVALMARDGVWRTEAPKQLASNSLVLTGASRADLAVRCSAGAELAVGGQTVANIVVDGSPNNAAAHPFVAGKQDDPNRYEYTWSANRPPYLRDLRFLGAGEIVNIETVNMGARTINGSKFDMMNPTFRFTDSAIQDWTLKGARNHPFHLHVYHVQVQGDCGSFEDGEYYDVISGNCNIRFDLGTSPDNPAYAGRTIMHCHILEHEDQGAMGWADVKVANASGPPTFPIPSDSNEVYDMGPYQLGDPPQPGPNAPSDLYVTAVSTSEIDLEWIDKSNDEDGFDIFYSTGGSNFLLRGNVGPDVTTYSDSGLIANTEYTYQVRAVRDSDVSDFSNAATARTFENSGIPTMLQLRSLTVGTVSEGKGLKSGQAIVVVEDDTGAPVTGALVTGVFQQSWSEPAVSDPTDINGSTTITTSEPQKGGVTAGFCVTGISDGPEGLDDWVGEICDPYPQP